MTRAWADIGKHLPAEIAGADVDAAVLTIWGVDWTLTVLGPWEGTLDGRAIYSDDDDVSVHLRSLIGEALLGVGSADLEDTGFQLSNGVLFVAPHAAEPSWRLRLDQHEFYGLPGRTP